MTDSTPLLRKLLTNPTITTFLHSTLYPDHVLVRSGFSTYAVRVINKDDLEVVPLYQSPVENLNDFIKSLPSPIVHGTKNLTTVKLYRALYNKLTKGLDNYDWYSRFYSKGSAYEIFSRLGPYRVSILIKSLKTPQDLTNIEVEVTYKSLNEDSSVQDLVVTRRGINHFIKSLIPNYVRGDLFYF